MFGHDKEPRECRQGLSVCRLRGFRLREVNRRLLLFGFLWLCYFAGAWNPVGCDKQDPVVDSRGKAQTQVPEQGLTTLQEPWQAATAFTPVRNCRAESVPAQRAAVTIVARNTVLIVFIISCAPPNFLVRQMFEFGIGRIIQKSSQAFSNCWARHGIRAC
jgi:hypothetical protein